VAMIPRRTAKPVTTIQSGLRVSGSARCDESFAATPVCGACTSPPSLCSCCRRSSDEIESTHRGSGACSCARHEPHISPDNWAHDQPLLDRPGNAKIQTNLLYDYRNNVLLYPKVQACLRERQSPTLLIWGKQDRIYAVAGAHAYKRDLKDLEFHLIDTGHFVLEDRRWMPSR
jgi:pimeloyl-ACP methyl ester carboxylesterase